MQYNYLQSMVMSFYSRKLYQDVAAHWGGYTIIYLLLLLAILWIPITFITQKAINKWYSEQSNLYVNQIPVLTFKEGQLITPENRPYIITDPKIPQPLGIIDTSGKYTDPAQMNTPWILTKDKMLINSKLEKSKEEQNDMQKSISYPPTYNQVFDPHVVNQKIEKYVDFVWVLIYPIFLLGSFVYRAIQSIFYSIIGKIFASVIKVPLPFYQVWQISIVALTPTLILNTIFSFFSIQFPFQYFLYFGLAMAYLFYGILSNKKN